jgi:hypothetical protein
LVLIAICIGCSDGSEPHASTDAGSFDVGDAQADFDMAGAADADASVDADASDPPACLEDLDCTEIITGLQITPQDNSVQFPVEILNIEILEMSVSGSARKMQSPTRMIQESGARDGDSFFVDLDAFSDADQIQLSSIELMDGCDSTISFTFGASWTPGGNTVVGPACR